MMMMMMTTATTIATTTTTTTTTTIIIIIMSAKLNRLHEYRNKINMKRYFPEAVVEKILLLYCVF
jgi:hypothetical protein